MFRGDKADVYFPILCQCDIIFEISVLIEENQRTTLHKNTHLLMFYM